MLDKSGKKSEKRKLILDAAFELILEKGYSNTKIIDIANGAGIGKGTLYEYFESKEALVLELVNSRVRHDFAKICEAMEKASTGKQKLTEYFRLEIETTAKYKSNLNDFRNEFMNSSAEISKEVLNAVHSIAILQFESIYRVIKEGVEVGEFKNVDPYTASACFMGSVSFYMSLLHHGMPFHVADEFRAAPANGNEDSFLDCIFNGLLA